MARTSGLHCAVRCLGKHTGKKVAKAVYDVLESCSGPHLAAALTQHLKASARSCLEHLTTTHTLLPAAAVGTLCDPASRAAQDVVAFLVAEVQRVCENAERDDNEVATAIGLLGQTWLSFTEVVNVRLRCGRAVLKQLTICARSTSFAVQVRSACDRVVVVVILSPRSLDMCLCVTVPQVAALAQLFHVLEAFALSDNE